MGIRPEGRITPKKGQQKRSMVDALLVSLSLAMNQTPQISAGTQAPLQIQQETSPSVAPDENAGAVQKLLAELKESNKKTKWNETIFEDQGWKVGGQSAGGRPLIYFVCGEKNTNTTLMLSSVHGDEITPVYFGLRLVSWVKGEPDLCKKYRIVVAPLVNPDGYLQGAKPSRTNKNGVDLNRNFPTKDFENMALNLWKTEGKSDPRRYPGTSGGSEPETKFQQWLIDEFKPSKILTVHSPLNFFDYDGPQSDDVKAFTREYIKSCDELRTAVKKASDYNFLRWGFFPGSLGNYAGKERGIPTLTLELPTVDASKARSYFEKLKNGTRALVEHRIKGQADNALTKNEP